MKTNKVMVHEQLVAECVKKLKFKVLVNFFIISLVLVTWNMYLHALKLLAFAVNCSGFF